MTRPETWAPTLTRLTGSIEPLARMVDEMLSRRAGTVMKEFLSELYRKNTNHTIGAAIRKSRTMDLNSNFILRIIKRSDTECVIEVFLS
jgi:hypothetical protein